MNKKKIDALQVGWVVSAKYMHNFVLSFWYALAWMVAAMVE
jgi:hypothetical protein